VKTYRTQNKFENACIAGIRKAWALYSPKYAEVYSKVSRRARKKNKDGSLSKRIHILIICPICGELKCKAATEIDHIEPVIELHKTRHDYTLEEIKQRIDCDISNLRVICKVCHKKKTAEERAIRKKKPKQ